MAFELFSKSEHMPELEETSQSWRGPESATSIPSTKIGSQDFCDRFRKRARLDDLRRGSLGTRSSTCLMRTAEGVKLDPAVQGDRKTLERRLWELAILAVAAMKK
jgi:hypothetical protein